MMKHLLGFLFVLILVAGFSLQAHAGLYNRGTDNQGNRLIYDSDLNITWYDYSNTSASWWSVQKDWASALTVNFNGTTFDDWRLPSALNSDGSGPCDFPSICSGSEMGHLYFIELGNTGSGLSNKGPFVNLLPNHYWFDTQYAPNIAWLYDFGSGGQGTRPTTHQNFGLAVRAGDVLAPEPISSILFITGGTLLAGRRFIRKKV